jgi:hypothetical protein
MIMAGLYDADKKLPMPGYMKAVLNAVNEEAPFLYLLSHGPAIANKLAQWPVQLPKRRGDPTGAEGADKTDKFEKRVPEVLSCYAQRVESDGWMITDLAELTNTAVGTGKTEAARQQAMDGKAGLLAVQDMLLGNQDTAESSTADDSMDRTRGVFSWLDSSAQGVLPVPAGVRPGTDQNYTGTLAAFLESTFEAALRAAGEQVDRDVDLVGYVGSDLAAHMAGWNQVVPVTASTEASTRMVTSKQDEKRIVKKVQFFDYHGATVKTIMQRRMLCDLDNAGAKTAYTTRSGVFVDMKNWVLEWLDPWHHVPLLDQGGGPRGFHKGWVRLVCKCPLGQVRAYIGS